MRIETKLSVGEYAWFMLDNRPQKDKVVKINIICALDADEEVMIFYFIGMLLRELHESLIFETKQELLDSL